MDNKYRPLSELDYGVPGQLTNIPSADPEKGPGTLHTSSQLSNCRSFNIFGSTAQLYPPSRTPDPPIPSRVCDEVRVQQRWLLKFHPEACMGNDVAETILKEDLRHFRQAPAENSPAPLLAVGEMRDMRDDTNAQGLPLLAVVTGQSGEKLRLTRFDESQWQWDDHEDAVLHLSIVDPIHREEEAVWMADAAPITRVKAVSYFSELNTVRWLLVQKLTSTTILQPEYNPMPMQDLDSASSNIQGVCFIRPNPVLTIHSSQTGGNAHSDVSFMQHSLDCPPQLAVIDECGYWTIWKVCTIRKRGKSTVQPEPIFRGNIMQGILKRMPLRSVYPAEKHGVILLPPSKRDASRQSSPEDTKAPKLTSAYSQRMVLWKAKRFELVDLESRISIGSLSALSPANLDHDSILDIQVSPCNSNHIFVLTTQKIIWMDLAGLDTEPSPTSRYPEVLISLNHIVVLNDDIRMSVSRASAADQGDTILVFTFVPRTKHLCVHWFHQSPETGLAQWHRYVTGLPGSRDISPRSLVRFLRASPAELEHSPESATTGPGTDYLQKGIQFYQVMVLADDLSVRYCICASDRLAFDGSKAPDLEPPTVRIGWSMSRDRRLWRKKRKYYSRYLKEAFVVPDNMTDTAMNDLERRTKSEEAQEKASEGQLSPRRRPIMLDMSKLGQTITRMLEDAANDGERGLPIDLPWSLEEVLKRGLKKGRMPLVTWAEVAKELGHNAPRLAHDDDMEQDFSQLFGRRNSKALVMPLCSYSPEARQRGWTRLSEIKQRYSAMWIDCVDGKFPEQLQAKRRAWLSEIAVDLFLSAHGAVVQDVPLFDANAAARDDDMESEVACSQPTIQCSQTLPPLKPAAWPSEGKEDPRAPAAGPPERKEDAALKGLKLLVAAIDVEKVAATEQNTCLALWRQGEAPEQFVSSIAAREAAKEQAWREECEARRRRRQRLVYRRPEGIMSSQGQGYADGRRGAEGVGGLREGSGFGVRGGDGFAGRRGGDGWPASSQVQVPSSQVPGPAVTMSQPIPGPFGKRKKAKRKPGLGFR